MRNQSREYRRRTGGKSPAIKAPGIFHGSNCIQSALAISSPRDSLRYLPRAENKDRKRDSSVGKERAPGSVKGASLGSANWKQRNAIEAFYFLTRFFYAPLSQCHLRLLEISLLSLSPFTLNFTFRALFSPESPYRRETRQNDA